jgi:hypothetical protein
MYAGSRTSLNGFPTRFERDVGAPLFITAAFGAGLIVRSRLQAHVSRKAVVVTAAAAASVVALMSAVSAGASLWKDSQTKGNIPTRPVAAAGHWLRQHNTGGTIITTPYMNRSVSNRAMLAMGGYAGLQSYNPERTVQPLIDSYQVLNYPASCQSARILNRDDVRYVVLYKSGPGADLAGFYTDQARYQPVFENATVIIYVPQHRPC